MPPKDIPNFRYGIELPDGTREELAEPTALEIPTIKKKIFAITDGYGKAVVRILLMDLDHFYFLFPDEERSGIWQASCPVGIKETLDFLRVTGGPIRVDLFIEWLKDQMMEND